MNKNIEEYYPILKVIRDEIKRNYVRSQEKNIVQITNLEGEVLRELDSDDFIKISDLLLNEIRVGKNTFEIPILEKFLNGLEIIQFKSPSQEKADFNMEILDLKTDISKYYSFSIKSELGSKATVLNASKATNFVYKIKEIEPINIMELNNINKETTNKWLKARLSKIQENINNKILEVSFVRTHSKVFSSNLQLIDSKLPYIISIMLMDYYANEGISDIKSLTERIIARNPLEISQENKTLFYKSNIIELIKSATFGMVPNKNWDKKYSVTGGLLTVKKSGDVLCHHIFYSKEALDEYLYRNTQLETASTSRYGTGSIYNENGEYYFTLNLQIRMK